MEKRPVHTSSAYFQTHATGYHRLWSHRAYKASKPLQFVLAVAGAGAVQGSIKWWCRHHRAHHRYTDTDLDPYGAHRGLWWSHIGWMLTKPRIQPGPADTSDLKQNDVVMWQHRWFFVLTFLFGLLLPTFIPGYIWNDWIGGAYFAGFLRLTLVHHVSMRGPLYPFSHLAYMHIPSLSSVSTPSLIGSDPRPSTTNSRLGTICSRRWSH